MIALFCWIVDPSSLFLLFPLLGRLRACCIFLDGDFYSQIACFLHETLIYLPQFSQPRSQLGGEEAQTKAAIDREG